MIPNIGPMEILVVLVIALVVFGPKRLPELGSSLGRGIRDFGKSLKDDGDDSRPAIEGATPASPAKVAPVDAVAVSSGTGPEASTGK